MTTASRFTVYPVVVDRPGGRYPEITGGHAEAEKILDLLDRHFDGMRTEPVTQATRQPSATQLGTWSGGTGQPRNSILIWIGHGELHQYTEAYLLTEEGNHPLSPDSIVRHLRDEADQRNAIRTGQPPSEAWAMMVVVACGAARFVELVQSRLGQGGNQPRRLLLIGVGDASPAGARPTFLGEFTATLTRVLDSYTDNDTEVDIYDLMGRLGRRFGDDAFVAPVRLFDGAPLLRRCQALPAGLTASLNEYRELARLVDGLTPEIRAHFATRALGADPTVLAWDFMGRADERREILRWLRSRDQGMLVVTGAAGVGKSALLGNLLMLRDARLTDVLIQRGHLDRDILRDRPDPDVFTAVLHLTGMSAAEVTDRLTIAAGLDPAPAEAVLADRVAALLTGLAGRAAGFTVLADALDESRQPAAIAAVLRRVTAISGCRVVVGTRASSTEGPDRPAAVGAVTGDLLDALGSADEHTSVLVVQRSRALMEDYVERQLRAATAAGRLHCTDATITDAARQIADGDRQFLFARLAVYEILRAPGLLGSPAEADRLFTSSHGALFTAAVQRLADRHPAGAALLIALAFTQGRGVPRSSGVWATIATAIGDVPVGEDDVDRLLDGASPYVLIDSEDGSAVYRLSHQTFRDHLSAAPDAADRRSRIADALLKAVAGTTGPLDRHLRRNLSAYVRAGERWAALAALPDVIDGLDPQALAADVVQAAFQGRPVPAAMAGIVDVWAAMAEVPVPERGLYRWLGLAGQQGLVTVEPDGPPVVAGPWRLRWAARERRPSRGRLPGSGREITALAAVPLTDGRTLLAAGSQDGSVRLWDPATGLPTGEPLTGHRGFVLGLAPCRLRDGRDLLVVGSGGGTVTGWDPNTGARRSSVELAGGLRQLSCVLLPDGQPVLFVGDATGMLHRLDATTGEPLGKPTNAHHGRTVTALITFDLPDGRTLVASGGEDGTVAVWNPRNGRQLARRSMIASAHVRALADLTPAGLPGSVAISSYSGVHVWQPMGRGILGRMEAVLGGWRSLIPKEISPATLISFGVPGGSSGVLCSANPGTELWHPRTGERLADIPTGSPGWTTAAAVLSDAAGLPILALGCSDGDVRLWGDLPPPETELPGLVSGATALLWTDDPSGVPVLLAGLPDGKILRCRDDGTTIPFARHPGRLRSLTVVPGDRSGRPATVVSCGGDGVPRRWDAATGAAIGPVIGRHRGEALCVLAYQVPDGRWRLASSGMDGTIRVWDPATGRPVLAPLTGAQAWVWRVVTVPTASHRPVLAASDADGVLHTWDGVDGRLIGRYRAAAEGTLALRSYVRALAAFTADDGTPKLLAGAGNGTLHWWNAAADVTTGHVVSAAPRPASVEAVAVVPGETPGAIVAGYADGALVLIDPLTGDRLHHIDLDGTVRCLAVSGNRVAVGQDGGVVLLELRSDRTAPIER
ncbi:WD40 repeat domain-containing protein [Micromonospora sp. WMMD712]|uniref:WD40 repeat domain-containing protein n=1 Tax=Micromonospora sp. WMMD712 TaxID=3016096 RepID=UPI00249C2CA3|nr:WD40 repeat domain-containing protein [Micromonospora sp. WMMD712]WFE59206.1 WD40 repeat domain-containing protein [Micromonospora sp. WMMD712]